MTSAAKPRPVFIAAMPREITRIVNGWRADETLITRKIHLFWNEDAVIACAGMGGNRALLAVQAALALGPASELISVGWAGACHERLQVGDVVRPNIVIDAKTGERFFAQRQSQTKEGAEVLVTVATPANSAEKGRLAQSYSASVVDMEAAAVARAAQARDLPFKAIKAISDEVSFELPDLAQFSTADGQFREAAFGFHVATHPRLWGPVRTLARGSRLAAGRLQIAIENQIQKSKSSNSKSS